MLAPLGPSAIVIGVPVALVASLTALRHAPDRVWAVVAAVVSALEALGLVVVVTTRALLG